MDESKATLDNSYKAHGNMIQFLFVNGWAPKPLTKQRGSWMIFNGKNGRTTCYAHIQREQEILLFYVVAPFAIPPERRLLMAEFITRVNFHFRLGNFEMNWDDGMLRFKSSVNFQGIELSEALMKYPLYFAALTMDQYLPGLKWVMSGEMSSNEAFITIQKQISSN